MSKTTRRTFLKASGAIATTLCADVNLLAAVPPARSLGLQLYSVRNLLPTQFDATLAKVRADGYTVVEAAGYYDRTAADFLTSMNAAGLHCVSTHHTLSVLEKQLERWIEYGQALGLEYFVCSSSGGMHRDPAAEGPQTIDDWRWIADEFNRIGERVKAAGMIFGAHNHTQEFAVIDGVLVYDELLRRTDPTLVIFEMDAGWVWASGHNPLDYLSKSPQRFPLMHVKDMIRRPDGKELMTVLGRGSVDYGPILHAAKGLKYSFVEQEQFEMEPIEELRLDAEFMRKLSA